MTLHLLPDRCGTAAENMATDFLLLQRYPDHSAVRLRHYTWVRPALTFGFSQKYALIREQFESLAHDAPLDLTRRATGGGIVDHRNDWTYALVIPRGHALEARPASQSYRLVHEALAAALTRQGVPAVLQLGSDTCPPSPSHTPPASKPTPAKSRGGHTSAVQCFQRAECFDVVRSDDAAPHPAACALANNNPAEQGLTASLGCVKIAGAAQKRTKHGLLFQGSVSRTAAGGEATDWEQFYTDFSAELARLLAVEIEPVGWPDFPDEELEGLVEQYASPEWREHR